MAIANPLSETFAVLRPSALPGLVDAVAHNRRREQRDVRLFEVGARFTRAGGERRARGVRLDRRGGTASTGAAARRDVDFFDIKAWPNGSVRHFGWTQPLKRTGDVAGGRPAPRSVAR